MLDITAYTVDKLKKMEAVARTIILFELERNKTTMKKLLAPDINLLFIPL